MMRFYAIFSICVYSLVFQAATVLASRADSLISSENVKCRAYVTEFDNIGNIDNFRREVTSDRDSNWVVLLYANWCGHSQEFAPYFNDLAEKYNTDPQKTKTRLENNYKFAAVDCGHKSEGRRSRVLDVCNELRVSSYPTLVFLSGKETDADMKLKGPNKKFSKGIRSKIKNRDYRGFEDDLIRFASKSKYGRRGTSVVQVQSNDLSENGDTFDGSVRQRQVQVQRESGPRRVSIIRSKNKLAEEGRKTSVSDGERESGENSHSGSRDRDLAKKSYRRSSSSNRPSYRSQGKGKSSPVKVEKSDQYASKSSSRARSSLPRFRSISEKKRFNDYLYKKAVNARGEVQESYTNLFYGLYGGDSEVENRYQKEWSYEDKRRLRQVFSAFRRSM